MEATANSGKCRKVAYPSLIRRRHLDPLLNIGDMSAQIHGDEVVALGREDS